MTKPAITATTHTLDLHKLSAREFERLCEWLVLREGYERVEHLGAAGSEQGRDLIAWSEGEQWAFQCKRVQSFGPADAEREVDKIAGLSAQQRPVGLVFLVTCDVSAQARQRARDRCDQSGLACRFWTGTELDEKIKRHADILREFFLPLPQAIVYEGIQPVTAQAMLEACQGQVADVLYSVRHKYNADLYVRRAIEVELEAFFDAPFTGPGPNCFLIVAPAGSGKTNTLCDLARRRVIHQPVLLLLGGMTHLSGPAGLLAAVESGLEMASREVRFRSAGDSLHTLDRLAGELDRDALILIDAINEYDMPAAMRKAVEDLLVKTRRRRIKLVITCRDYYWGLFAGDFWEGATVNQLPQEDEGAGTGEAGDGFKDFTVDEYERALPLYLAHYQIRGRPVGEAAAKCRHPLLLLFFCEAYRGQPIGEVEDILLKELFTRYWERKLESIAQRMLEAGGERLLTGLADEVGDYLLAIAAYMLRQNVRAIPLAELAQATGREERYDDPRSLYGRIRDEFIILVEMERGTGRHKRVQIAFVYEEFMEYLMARSLMRDWERADLDDEAILNDIEVLTGKYESFAQILGVMVYLALMLREERDLALWQRLLSQGERWQKVVLEAFRKLPEDQLDDKVYDALADMLASGDEQIEILALDTLKIQRIGRAATADVVRAVVDLITHDSKAVRRRAPLALKHTARAELALPALAQALSDARWSVRQNAQKVLLERGDEKAMELLIPGLQDGRESVRLETVQAIGELGQQTGEPDLCARAAEVLLGSLDDPDEGVQWQALEALGRLIPRLQDADLRDRIGGVLLAKSDWGEWAILALPTALAGLDDPRAVPPLFRLLGDSTPEVREGAARALGELGVRLEDARLRGEVIERLGVALDDWGRGTRQAAAWALGRLRDPVAVEHLLLALQNSDGEIRFEIAAALARLGIELDDAALRTNAARELIALFREPKVTIRQQASESLGELGPSALPLLLEAIKDQDRRARSCAASALGALTPRVENAAQLNRLVQALDGAVRDGSSVVRQAAASSLVKVSKVIRENPAVRQAAAQELVAGDPAESRLVAALNDGSAEVRAQAAEALGQLGEQQAVDPLAACLEDRSKKVREAAIDALRLIGTPEAMTAVRAYEQAHR